MDTNETKDLLSKIEQKCADHSDSDVRVAFKDLQARLEKLRQSATATHATGKDDPDTIAIRKRRAKQAIERLREHSERFLYLGSDLDDLEAEIESVQVSALT